MNSLDSILSEVERLSKLSEAASEGPWTAHDNQGCRYVSNGKDGPYAKFDNRVCEAVLNLHLTGKTKDANMNLIAASRTAVPQLLAAIKEMAGALEKYSRMHDDSGLGACPAAFSSTAKCLCGASIGVEALSRAAEILKGKG